MSERTSHRRHHAGRRRRQRQIQDLIGLQTCKLCGCTDDDCERCVVRTGQACRWIGPDLCSACAGLDEVVTSVREVLADLAGETRNRPGTAGASIVAGLTQDLESILESYRGGEVPDA